MLKRSDPFTDPTVAQEMQRLLGVRYVCMKGECSWKGDWLDREDGCPVCHSIPHDRWTSHANTIIGGQE